MLSKLIRSAASSFPPRTAHVCTSARPPRQNPTFSRSIATSRYPRTSSPQSAPGPSLQIVTNPQPIPLIRNNFVFRKLEVGLTEPDGKRNRDSDAGSRRGIRGLSAADDEPVIHG